jgi:hypothetical protein
MGPLELLDSKLDLVASGQRRLEDKLDSLLKQSGKTEQLLETHNETLIAHAKILYLNTDGGKPLLNQVEEIKSDIRQLQTVEEPSRKDQYMTWGKALGAVLLVVSSVLQWFGYGS